MKNRKIKQALVDINELRSAHTRYIWCLIFVFGCKCAMLPMTIPLLSQMRLYWCVRIMRSCNSRMPVHKSLSALVRVYQCVSVCFSKVLNVGFSSRTLEWKWILYATFVRELKRLRFCISRYWTSVVAPAATMSCEIINAYFAFVRGHQFFSLSILCNFEIGISQGVCWFSFCFSFQFRICLCVLYFFSNNLYPIQLNSTTKAIAICVNVSDFDIVLVLVFCCWLNLPFIGWWFHINFARVHSRHLDVKLHVHTQRIQH